MSKSSAVEAVENFLDQFLDIYDQLNKKDQGVLTECFHQMFRKYYYSTLLPDTPLTPANIINTLVEREFNKNVMVIPTLKVNYYKNKKSKISILVSGLSGRKSIFLQGIWQNC
ncbi:MAG: hypothetical protein ACM3TR_19225 [Caulobacteraceae bacterium]